MTTKKIAKIKKVTKFTIDRKKWGRNNPDCENSGGFLYQKFDDGTKMCCLGFASKAFGISNNDMEGMFMPYSLPDSNKEKLPSWLTNSSSKDSLPFKLSCINDNYTISDTDKEKAIIAEFAKYDVTVTFKG